MATDNNPTIVVYTKQNCIYCTKAKNLLDNLNLKYEVKNLEDYSSVDALLEDIGKKVKSMPQIKIDNKLIGGYNQLVEHFVQQGKVNFKGEILD